jgi:AhpC/TSA family
MLHTITQEGNYEMKMKWRSRPLLAMILAGGMLWLLSVGGATALQVGDQAPTFSLPATTAENVSLADYLGHKHVVVFFYIAAFGRA